LSLPALEREGFEPADRFGEGLALADFLRVVVLLPLEGPDIVRRISFSPTSRASFKEDWFSMAKLIRAIRGKSLVIVSCKT
jgi:hypothetical protein